MGIFGSSIFTLLSLSRVRMRLTVAWLAGSLGDPHAGPALAPQALDALDQLHTNAARTPMRTRGTIPQRGQAAFPIPLDPLGSTLPAEPALGCRLAHAQPAFHNTFRKLLSTVNRQSSMMVIVHSIS
jgi:hypothetical protein